MELKKSIIKSSKNNTTNKDALFLGVNPFLSNFEILAVKSNNTEYSVIVEQDKKVNVYVEDVYRKTVAELTNNGKSLFLYIMYKLESNKDYITINKDKYMIENNITSLNTFKSSVSELKRLAIISDVATKKWTYWINPRFFFNGNRAEKFSNHVK